MSHLNQMSGTCKLAVVVACVQAFVLLWLCAVATTLEAERDNAEAALSAAITVINTASPERLDKVCPAWLFDTNALAARNRICGGKNGNTTR